MEKIHPSDSREQREIEKKVLELLEKRLELKLTSGSISLDGNTHIQVDAFDKEKKVFIEIYSGIGDLKPSQIKKVITDGFKLLTLQKVCFKNQDCQKIICFIDVLLMILFGTVFNQIIGIVERLRNLA